MTRRNNARVAGAAFLLYIALGLGVIALEGVTDGSDIATRLIRYAEHEARVRIGLVLSLVTSGLAITLAITLDALTRGVDRELAGIGRGFRLAEGILGAGGQLTTLGVLWLAGRATGGVETEAGLLLHLGGWNVIVCATLFAAGSTLFCWLFLRGRIIPSWLAWPGLCASVLLVAVLVLQLAGISNNIVSNAVWASMALFEIVLGFWLIFRGVAPVHFAADPVAAAPAS